MAQLAEDDVLAPHSAAADFWADQRPALLRLQIFADSCDAGLAATIARELATKGHAVVGGAHDPETIDAVLVIWSDGALKSPAMLAAARAAQSSTPIIPVSVGAVAAPPDFPEPAPMPLDGWLGDPDDPRWRFVIDELALVAIRRGPPAFLRPPVEAADPRADRSRPTLAAEPRRAAGPRQPRPDIDIQTMLMAAAAVALFVAFALLSGRADRAAELVAIDSSPAAEFRAQEPAPPVLPAPVLPAPVLAATPQSAALGAIEPPAPRPVRQPTKPIAANLAPAMRAPTPSIKPKRAPSLQVIKPSGVIDPLAALIVKTTERSAATGPRAFQDCVSCPPMLRIAPGRLATVADRQIAVARPFALGAREITFAEWDACVVDGGCGAYRPSDAGWGRNERPVVNVSFEDATAYADWLSARTGARYRLPTDEEWTFAAGSGGARPIKSGAAPAPAAGVPADAHGARGLLGNVWEWTADCTSWTPAGACAARIVKGGAWNTGDWRKTPHHRLSKPETVRDFDLGFRLVRDL